MSAKPKTTEARPAVRRAKIEGGTDGRQPGALQTLDRGLQALSIIANDAGGLTIPELAERLGVHRTIAYRLASTLEAHGLVARSHKGLRLGAAIVALSSRFEPHLRDVAQPVLDRLANATSAAAFISVPQGSDCVAIMVAEPDNTLLRVAYRIGSRHLLTRGAAGIAILAGRPALPGESELVQSARADGYSATQGQLQPGAVGVASPLHRPDEGGVPFEASIGVVTLGEADTEKLADAVLRHTEELRDILAGDHP